MRYQVTILFLIFSLFFSDLGLCATASKKNTVVSQSRNVSADVVLIGLHINKIPKVEDAAQNFTAEFDLWLRFRGTFDPNEIMLLNTTTPMFLHNPVYATDKNGEHFRLFHLTDTFRFEIEQKDLAQNIRKFSIQLGWRDPYGDHLQKLVFDVESMKLDLNGIHWDEIFRDNAGWKMQAEDLHNNSASANQQVWKKSEPVLVATMTVEKLMFSPKKLIAALIPADISSDLTFIASVLMAILIAITWLPHKKIPRRYALLARLLFSTLGLYLLEFWMRAEAMNLLSLSTYRDLLAFFDALWWFVPAIWIDSLLPPFVWDPISQRTGHPVPSISRTIVKLSVYVFSLMLMLHFVYDQSFGNIWAASGVLGIILGIALQSLILDAFAGFMLNTEQPFKILQWIKLESRDIGVQVGQVLEMNWRTTKLWTRNNDIISIPNSLVSKSKITNFAIPTPASRQEFMLTLDHAIPTKLALKILKRGALRAVETGKILAEPKQSVVVVGFENQGIKYKILYYINMALVSRGRALGEVADAIMSCLAEEGIDPLPPTRVRHERAVNVANVAVNNQPDTGNSRASDTVTIAAATPQAVADSVSLTSEQVRIIQHTWELVVPIAGQAAKLFYARLFELNPKLKPLFRTTPTSQGMKLIGMLSIVVKGIGNLDTLLDTVQELGLRHVNYGVKDEYYDTVGEALLWALEQSLGNEWTPEVKNAWVIAYTILSSAMKTVAH